MIFVRTLQLFCNQISGLSAELNYCAELEHLDIVADMELDLEALTDILDRFDGYADTTGLLSCDAFCAPRLFRCSAQSRQWASRAVPVRRVERVNAWTAPRGWCAFPPEL